jgi:hypothetical protein
MAERIGVPDGYPAMKEHRLKQSTLARELLMALAASSSPACSLGTQS